MEVGVSGRYSMARPQSHRGIRRSSEDHTTLVALSFSWNYPWALLNIPSLD